MAYYKLTHMCVCCTAVAGGEKFMALQRQFYPKDNFTEMRERSYEVRKIVAEVETFRVRRGCDSVGACRRSIQALLSKRFRRFVV